MPKIVIALTLICVAIIGGFAAALILGVPKAPPPLGSIAAAGELIAGNLSDLPRLETFAARDATALGFRRYPGLPGNGVAVLVHGSSGSSVAMHALGKALSSTGIAAIAVDIRGHGASGRRGDIDYAGQLNDDMADLLGMIERDYPSERRVLIGHSSGGSYALHIAASPLACRFDGYIALTPYLNYRAPTVRPANGGWSGTAMSRIIALSILRRLGFTTFEYLPVVAFAISPDAGPTQTRTYSFRLLMDFGLDARWQEAIRRIDQPTQVLAGSKDELFYADAFKPTIAALSPQIGVAMIDGVNHMGMVLDDAALAATARAATSLLTDRATDQCAPPNRE